MIQLQIETPPFQEHPDLWSGRLPEDRAARLVNWRIEPQQVDGGMPEALSDLVSRWLCAMGTVIFPRDRSLLGRVRWCETKDAGQVMQLFECADFPWWMGLQAALIRNDAGSKPPLDAQTAKILTGEDWATAVLPGDSSPGAVRLRAGIDGDAICMIFSSSETTDAAMIALAELAGEAGVVMA